MQRGSKQSRDGAAGNVSHCAALFMAVTLLCLDVGAETNARRTETPRFLHVV